MTKTLTSERDEWTTRLISGTGRDDADCMNIEFDMAKKQISESDTTISEAQITIAKQEGIRKKMQGILENVTGKETEGAFRVEPPVIPEAWKSNLKLGERFHNLLEVIRINPHWWNHWKGKIELQDDGVNFKELSFVLDLNDSSKKQKWSDLEKNHRRGMMTDFLPKREEWGKIYEFIYSAGEENREYLRYFLDLGSDDYWSATCEQGGKVWCQNFVNDGLYNDQTEIGKYGMACARHINRY